MTLFLGTYVGDAITAIRRDTRNLDTYSASNQTGISDEDFLRYYNFAQERIYSLIVNTKAKVFLTEEEFTIDGSESYSLTGNVYLKSSISDVKFSHSGEDKDYREIRERDMSYRDFNESSYAKFYSRKNNEIFLSPRVTNTSAKLLVTHRRMIDRVDTRRGQVTARTLSATQLTALTLNTSSDDATALGSAQILCVCNKYGVPQMINIPITSYDSGTGVVTLDAYTFAAGETVAVGDYVTIGEFTRTHTELPRSVERYLELYTAEKIFGRDSNNDIADIREERIEVEKEIIQSYAMNAVDDEIDIQIDDPELLINGE
jgi:hypothetical protein